jgi:hypothetical protein
MHHIFVLKTKDAVKRHKSLQLARVYSPVTLSVIPPANEFATSRHAAAVIDNSEKRFITYPPALG